ncbi:MAG: hypothetical protein MK033_07835 [Candidatus Caenarcaniphilales bacterium]|nr:hypothetical protein [Candidatus Caenarcaniphilales bacterium]
MSGDIGGTGGFDGKKIADNKAASKNKKDANNDLVKDTEHRQKNLAKRQKENLVGRYANSSSSQKSITKIYRDKHKDEFSNEKKEEVRKEESLKSFEKKRQLIETEKDKALVKNPVLKSKLDLSSKVQKQSQTNLNQEGKAKPPRPSLKSLLAPKGIVHKKMNYKELIEQNPALKGVSSVDIDNAQELGKILEGHYLLEQTTKENNKANHKLDKQRQKMKQVSLAEVFQFDYEVVGLSANELRDLISELGSDIDSEELRANIDQIVNLFQDNKPIQNHLLLFFPFPLPFEFQEIDEEFEEELNNLEKENQEKSDDGEDFEEEDDDEEFEADVTAGISIFTYNFGRILALLRYSKSLSKLEISFKGDANAEELAIALSSNLEFELPIQMNIKEKRFKTWKNKSFKNLENEQTRTCQIMSEGEIDATFSKACKVIFNSIEKSDRDVTKFEKNKEGKII